VKVLRKWEGAVWDHERPSVVELRTPEAVLEKLAYVMANPVAAGLVRYVADWPGITTSPKQLGAACLQAKRPDFYFDAENSLWPAEVSLDLTMPALPGMSDAQIRDAVAALVLDAERQARADVRARGDSHMGAKRIRKASPYDRAKSWEPLRGRNPHFAVGRGQKAAFFEAVAGLRAFRSAYRDALQRWRNGARDALFPAGTWCMRVVHAACVHDACA
jgi:hypothetical protein